MDSRRILFVDLTTSEARLDRLDAKGTLGLGGKALGVRLLERYLAPAVDPLGPHNIVVLTPSPIAGYAMSGSDRFGAFCKSPLTGIWLEAYCGGTFARTLRETGWDAVVLAGAAPGPVRVHITTGGATVASADELWGKDTFETEAELLGQLDKRSAVLSIGVAGENLVKVASIMHEQAHTLGRGGMGAVLGSKRVKAVTVTSPGALKLEAQEQFVATRREISRLASESPGAVNYRRFGTPMVVAVMNEAKGFPTDFFTRSVAPHRATLEAEFWPQWARVESDTCPPCPMRCRKRLTILEGPEAGREMHGPEYETLYSFGGSCMVEHAIDVTRLNERCNILGMDTISSGNLLALAMKGQQLGLVNDGPAPGDTTAMSELLGHIAARSTPLGDTLARGMDSAAASFGMSDWIITTKGLDPAGYEPRRLKGMALSYAVSARGGCHLRATFYKPELAGQLEGMDDEEYVDTYIDWEDRMLLADSLVMCRFYRDFLSWDYIVSAASQLNGEPLTKSELQALSTDVTTRIRRLNLAMGMTPADDTVAERFFEESTDVNPPLDRQELENRVKVYWRKRGWSAGGYPPEG